MEGNQERGPSGRMGRRVSRTVLTSAWCYTVKEQLWSSEVTVTSGARCQVGSAHEKPTALLGSSSPSQNLKNSSVTYMTAQARHTNSNKVEASPTLFHSEEPQITST